MWKIIKILLTILCLGVIVFCAVNLSSIWKRYKNGRETYSEASEQFTKPSVYVVAKPVPQSSAAITEEDEPVSVSVDTDKTDVDMSVLPPITVDFAELTSVNSNIIGWICCEGTKINYPVVYGVDNEYYLKHDYRGNPDGFGTIFSDAANIKGFSDSNVILYGHNMNDLSMFATLRYWMKQDYLDEHPVMWLLTPEQDYMVELFAAYETQADSDTYKVFHGPGPQFEDYLRTAVSRSPVSAPVELDTEAHYVMLSTCAYSNELARTVLHGKLVPVRSIGGVPINSNAFG